MLETHLGYLYARDRTRARLARHGEPGVPAVWRRTAGLVRALAARLARP